MGLVCWILDHAALDIQSEGAALFINAPGQPTFINPNGGIVGIGTTQPRTSLHSIGRISTGLDFASVGAITFFPPDGFAWSLGLISLFITII